jgi:hypothetical protein
VAKNPGAGVGRLGSEGSSGFPPALRDVITVLLHARASVVEYLTRSGKKAGSGLSRPYTARLAAATRRAGGGLGCSPGGKRVNLMIGAGVIECGW